jgi:hypothetical protein
VPEAGLPDWEVGEWLGWATESPEAILERFVSEHEGFFNIQALSGLALLLARGPGLSVN